MPQAMKIRAEKAAVDKEWEKLEKISAWNLTKVRSKKEVIDEGRTPGAKVHFVSLMDICQLKNAELEAKQKYNGRVVLRGDIVKDDTGSYAVFTEQGSSASYMRAAFKETIKNARKKLETSVPPAMPCNIMKNCGSGDKNKTKLACILEANESTRMRMGYSQPHNHEDHIAGKGENSLQHYNLVHKFIPMPQAMKIPAAKAAVDKEWEN